MSEANVTIIVPILNRADVLPRLFRSLDAVTYESMQVILVDNDSTDDSYSFCQQYATEAAHPTTVLQQLLPGANAARNMGLSQCKTEWVYFFDSDDELTPNFLDVLMPLTKDRDLIAFKTRLEERGRLRTRDFVCSHHIVSQILSSTLNTQGMLIRTKFITDAGGWNEELSVWQDWELGIRLLLAKPRIHWYTHQTFHILHQQPKSITYETRTRDRMNTMEAVNELLRTRRQHRALYLRFCILQGKLLHEGKHKHIYGSRHQNMITRLHGWVLNTYTRFGGRGAWRLAMLMV